MGQRTAFAVAIVLTTFLLVIAAGVLARLAVVPATDTGSQATTIATTIAATTASFSEQREMEYQQALQTAYAQVEKANEQLEDVYGRLTAQPTVVMPAGVTDAPSSISLPIVPTSPPVTEAVPMEATPAVTEIVPTQPPPVPSAPAATGSITPEQAAAAARAYAGGGTVERVRLEEEHSQRVYEVRFTDNSRVYVDPVSGRVIYARLEGQDGNGDDTSGNDD